MRVPFSLGLLLCGSLQAAQAVRVYMSPAPGFYQASVTPEEASATLSRHLGLESFEPFQEGSPGAYKEESFVGQDARNSLIISVEETDARAILPDSLQPAFTLPTPPITPIYSLSSVLMTYLHRARQEWFPSVYAALDFGNSEDVSDLKAFLNEAEEPSFTAIELSKLHETREKYGFDSYEYSEVTDQIRNLLQDAAESDNFNVVVLAFASPSSPSLIKRSAPQESQVPFPAPPPQLPIGGVSTCFTTIDACNNGTSSCSGRGECAKATKAGKTCFVCSCGVTKIGEGNKVKTTYWAGDSCERKDVSGPFVLLAGTVIVMILLIVGSVSLLNSVGDQALPSTLLATAVPAKRD